MQYTLNPMISQLMSNVIHIYTPIFYTTKLFYKSFYFVFYRIFAKLNFIADLLTDRNVYKYSFTLILDLRIVFPTVKKDS